MQLTSLLTQLDKQAAHVTCFTGPVYPSLFFFHLKKAVTIKYSLQVVDLEQPFSAIQTQCSMSFLGQHNTLWLGNVSSLSPKQQQKLLNFCASYNGPHTLWLFCTEPEKYPDANWQIFNLPETVSFDEYKALCVAWYSQLSTRVDALAPVFDRYTVDLLFASVLLQYHLVLGRQTDAFIQDWCSKLVKPEHSLFTLSAHFFGKKATPFFRLWKSMGPNYPATFWASYWSEQLFRASCVTQLLQDGNYAHAKKLSYRLPFSFMQREYKRTDCAQLEQAHQFMYEYDVHIKNSGTVEFLEVMFSAYFTGSSFQTVRGEQYRQK